MNKSIMMFFMGLSGAGKDTQAGLIREFLKKKDGNDSVLWLSTGDVLREIVKSGAYAGKAIDEKIMKLGDIAPPFLATLLWAEKAVRGLAPDKHLVFPSSPRTMQEAEDLDAFALFFGIENVFPVFINVNRDEAYRRLAARGRADDTDAVIRNRLDYFSRHVLPAVRYFRKKSAHPLIEIDGNSPDELAVHQSILKATGLAD